MVNASSILRILGAILLQCALLMDGGDLSNTELNTTPVAQEEYVVFMNADQSTSCIQFYEAQQAYEVINNTLYNEDSNLFGKIGREQFKIAVEFIIGSETDYESENFKKRFETAGRYLNNPPDCINNFVDDLLASPFLNSKGQIDTQIRHLSRWLGTTDHLVDAMFREYDLYQKTPIELIDE